MQQFYLNKGLKVFQENGEKAAKKELDQLVRRHCWRPMDVKDMTPEERKNGKRVIYVLILKAIYGMLQASLLWYRKLRQDLEAVGFKFNPYDQCIANKMVNGYQQTIRFHVDDLLSSHVDPKVNDDFLKWLNEQYGSIKEVTSTRGKIHTYLGMTLDFSVKGKFKVRMDDYVTRMLEDFPVNYGEQDTQCTPAGVSLLEKGKGKKLETERKETFHSFVARGLFLYKRVRLDIHPAITVLASRVQDPNQSDWTKLCRMMKYLHSTQGWHLTLKADDLKIIKWYVDYLLFLIGLRGPIIEKNRVPW